MNNNNKQQQKIGKSERRYLRPPLIEILVERGEQRGAGCVMLQ